MTYIPALFNLGILPMQCDLKLVCELEIEPSLVFDFLIFVRNANSGGLIFP